MNRAVVLTAFFLLIVFTSTAEARPIKTEGTYGGLNFGYSILSDSDLTTTLSGVSFPSEIKFDSALAFGGVIGHDFGQQRFELEVGYKSFDEDEGCFPVTGCFKVTGDNSVNIMAFMFNGYHDFETGSMFEPYIGAGIGVANVKIDEVLVNESANVFAYQAKLGLNANVSRNFIINLEYKYFGALDPSWDYNASGFRIDQELTIESHDFMVGVRYYF